MSKARNKAGVEAGRKSIKVCADPEYCPYCGGYDLHACNEIGTDDSLWIGKCLECGRVFEVHRHPTHDLEDGQEYTFGEED